MKQCRFLISAIVPVYNSQNTLSECIESILNQTETNFELVLINDGSEDDSFEICKWYAKRDNRVKVLNQSNKGVSAARNHGIKNALGEFLTFIDSDDKIEKTFFENAISHIRNKKVDVYMSGLVMEYYDKNKIIEKSVTYAPESSRRYNTKTLLNDLLLNYPQICICGPCCKLYRRGIIKNNNIQFNTKIDCGEDTLFNLDILKQNPRIYMDSQLYYHYRRENENSLFSKFSSRIYENHLKIYDEMRVVMKKFHCNAEAMQRFENMYGELMLGCVKHYYIHKDKNKNKEKYDIIKRVSKNENIKIIKNPNMKLNNLVIRLMKCRCYGLVYLIFTIRYINE